MVIIRELLRLDRTGGGKVAVDSLRLTAGLGTAVAVVVTGKEGVTVVDVRIVETGSPRSTLICEIDAFNNGCLGVPADPRERSDTGENKGGTLSDESEACDLNDCAVKLCCLSFVNGVLGLVPIDLNLCFGFGAKSLGTGVPSLAGTSSASGVGAYSDL